MSQVKAHYRDYMCSLGFTSLTFSELNPQDLPKPVFRALISFLLYDNPVYLFCMPRATKSDEARSCREA
jgi:hypothetical protein